MLSITTLGTTDGEAVIFVQASDRTLGSIFQQLPAWVKACEDARVDVFVQLDDRVLRCPITQFLMLTND